VQPARKLLRLTTSTMRIYVVHGRQSVKR
jgi:hypothetical protein